MRWTPISAARTFGPVFLLMLSLGCHMRPVRPVLAPQRLHDEAEMAAYLEAFPYEQYQVFEVPEVGKFYLDDNPASVKKALRSGRPWEPGVMREFKKHVVPGTTVLDVGAHIGSLTVPFARLVGPEGRVFAFEPQKKIFRELVHNLELNDLTNAIPLRFALGSRPGIIEMNPIDTYDGRVSIGKGGDRAEKRTVDSFGFADVSVIKIDVEGHEAQVLKGARRTIDAFHPAILVEIWEADRGAVRLILEEMGYSLRSIEGTFNYVAIFKDRSRTLNPAGSPRS